jgi:hypothetical protein
MSKYLREHTPSELVDRFVDGAEEVMAGMILSYGYFKFIEIYVGLLILARLLLGAYPAENPFRPAPNPVRAGHFVVYFCCMPGMRQLARATA